MSLPAGARLGPYEVTSQIGAGGMGEVYSAIDTNLKRSVALKVLPASVAKGAGEQQGARPRPGPGQAVDIWLHDLVSGARTRFTFGRGSAPVWSPDGSRPKSTDEGRRQTSS